MPVLRRKVIRNVDGITIEESNETTQTKTVSVIPAKNTLICDKCGKDLTIRNDQNVTIECSQCGCPTFHTALKFSIQCVHCGKIREADKQFYGYCQCNNKIWKLL